MGVYSNNRTTLSKYNGEDIVANENYFGEIGACQIMIENAQNDQAVFDAVIRNDFTEAALSIKGSVEESAELGAVLESGASGFIEKIKEFVQKVWAKIKGLFKSFFAKIDGVITRDNKKLVEKHKKAVLTKDLSKMKYKWADPTGELESPSSAAEIGKSAAWILGDALSKDFGKIESLTEKIDSGDRLQELLGMAVGSSTCESSEFAKEYHDKCFKDEDSEEGLANGRLNEIMSILTESSKTLKAAKKMQGDIDKAFSNILKQVDKQRTEVSKMIPDKKNDKYTSSYKDSEGNSINGGTDTASNMNKRLNFIYKEINVSQIAMNKTASAMLTETKNLISQCRRVFSQAAAFNAKSVKEDAMLIEAVGESAEFEFESSFVDYEF